MRSGVKHDPSFPLHAIKYCLEPGGAKINSLDAIVFYDKPLVLKDLWAFMRERKKFWMAPIIIVLLLLGVLIVLVASISSIPRWR